MSEVELKKQKVFQLIQEFDDENLLDEVLNFLQENKHTILYVPKKYFRSFHQGMAIA